MILNADAKQLEWICAAFLSQDKTAIKEILNEEDQHTDNQKRFGLPSRLIAKTFVFRLIYGGSAYAYSLDENFKDIGDENFWDNVIIEFYKKYKGLHKWHQDIQEKAIREQHLIMPTGRKYEFESTVSKFGKLKHPRTRILNYPVQGLGADLMAIARVSLRSNIRDMKGVKLINTVHDSIMLDFDPKVCYTNSIVPIVIKCFNDVPRNFTKLFGKEFNLPLRVDVTIGKDWGNLVDV